MEMDYKKAYKQALERARQFSEHPLMEDSSNVVEYVFPELRESEDERIRKKLLNLLKELLELGGVAQDTWSMNDCEQFIAWLEKQGKSVRVEAAMKEVEEKSQLFAEAHKGESADEILAEMRGEERYLIGVDLGDLAGDKGCRFNYSNATIQQKDFATKVEPKFKVGDWITDGEVVFQITSYHIDYGYQLKTQKGTSFHFSDENVESKYHLWTFDDAKDGDILYISTKELEINDFVKQEWLIIYENYDSVRIRDYAAYPFDGDVYTNSIAGWGVFG